MADGRFAPSPTGSLHLGNLRTALLAWLFARSAASRFAMRIEDLDQVAARRDIAREQLADLVALGLDWDGPVVRQSECLDRHRDAIADLDRRGLLYPCYCTRREVAEAAAAPHGDGPDGAYPGTCRELTRTRRAEREAAGRRGALRVRAGEASVSFVDRLHGARVDVVDDFVVQRNDGTPAYNLAVVVDDAAQGVAEVVRGDDLLPTTGRQVWLAGTLGVTVPTYAHVPLVLAPDGRRLAKRDGSVTLADAARDRGETPALVCGRLAASVGLAEPGEPVRPAELIERFAADALPRDPWVLTPADL